MHGKMPKAYLLHTSNIFNYLALPLACTTNKQNLNYNSPQRKRHRPCIEGSFAKSHQYFIESKEFAYTHLHPPYPNRKAYCSFDDRNMHINANGTCICLESGQFRPDPWAVIWAPKKCSHWRELLLITLIPLTKTNLYIIS